MSRILTVRFASRAAALALTLAAAALATSAYAGADDQTASVSNTAIYGGAEGFGGFKGRVGPAAPASSTAAAEPVAGPEIGSAEGFGGFKGRVGPPLNIGAATNGTQQAGR
jgi:hypothetical protein